jgi:Uma2 family endonuclease
MTSNPTPQRFTYEEYLAREEASLTKHEYLRGEIIDMAGATPSHGGCAMNLAILLGSAIADRPCRLFSSDVRVRIEATDLSTYPDLSVVCGALATSERDANAITNPVLLAEVLSPGTESYDRGAKLRHYLQLSSLQEVVFVNHTSEVIEVYRRGDSGRFELLVFEAGDTVELTSVGARFPVAKVYENRLAAG